MSKYSEALFTDLYQLTMMQAYFNEGMHHEAVFEFFIRRMPTNRHFYLTIGLTQVLEYLQNLKFSSEDIAYLRSLNKFTEAFLNYLQTFKFTGDVYAMPEGTIAFENEPIIQIVAPIMQAQLIESRLINLIQFQTMIASKAARCKLLVNKGLLVDFGMRRAHGFEAGLLAARACYLAGFDGTATVLAGQQFQIPVFGTMAHSYIQAHDNEQAAFIKFAESMPDNVVLLIDTYDTERGAHFVVSIAEELKKKNIKLKAVRIDSGDLAKHAFQVREILDAAGLTDTTIFVSGDLDEYKLKDLINKNAPIQGFGIGTKLDTSADLPSLDSVYKLQAYAGKAKRKKSEFKQTWPGRKQVYRFYDEQGVMQFDKLCGFDETVDMGKPLLQPVIRAGQFINPQPTTEAIRTYVQKQYQLLPSRLKDIESTVPYEVQISAGLQRLTENLDKELEDL